MAKERRKKNRLPYGQKCRLMYLYLCTKTTIKELAEIFEIDRSTVHQIINKFHYPVRKPKSGNRSNHPTKFDQALTKAIHDHMTGGDD